MPTVTVKGKTKKFPYSPTGKIAAKKYAKSAGVMMQMKKKSKKHGISNLKMKEY